MNAYQEVLIGFLYILLGTDIISGCGLLSPALRLAPGLKKSILTAIIMCFTGLLE